MDQDPSRNWQTTNYFTATRQPFSVHTIVSTLNFDLEFYVFDSNDTISVILTLKGEVKITTTSKFILPNS